MFAASLRHVDASPNTFMQKHTRLAQTPASKDIGHLHVVSSISVPDTDTYPVIHSHTNMHRHRLENRGGVYPLYLGFLMKDPSE